MAAVLAVVEVSTKKLHFCSAGQLPLLLVRAENGAPKVQALKSSGIALGLDSGPVFDDTLEEKVVELRAGDRVVLFSEGVLKVKNEKGEEFGEARFRELVEKLASRNSSAFVNLVMGNVDKWRGSAPQTDDVTVATLKVM
jgi:serine phosphatase RsbU (regulator of sigma subunit)